VFLIGLKGDYAVNTNISEIVRNIKMSVSGNCYKNNINAFLSKNPAYISIVNKVKIEPDFNGKVFSFPPGDSIFYALFNQIPPFYNSFDSGASLRAQNEAIKYIEKNNIRYVIFNFVPTDNIVEGVPSYIRQSTEFKYILNNFYPLEIVSDHLILIKKDNSDFLKSPLLEKIQQYRASLLNVYLYMIPYSEGLYKYQTVNDYLKTNNISSRNKVIVLIPSVSSRNGTLNYLKITSGDGMESTIYFNSCKKEMPCIINLANIPLFYKDRNIAGIQLDGVFKGELRVIELKNFGDLW
jgi:hypothetical protein